MDITARRYFEEAKFRMTRVMERGKISYVHEAEIIEEYLHHFIHRVISGIITEEESIFNNQLQDFALKFGLELREDNEKKEIT